MGYVRYKMPDGTHKIMKNVCKRLGMKESEFSRIAVIEYMRSMSVLSEKVKKMRIIRR